MHGRNAEKIQMMKKTNNQGYFTQLAIHALNNNQHNVISTLIFVACNLLKSLKLSGINKPLPKALVQASKINLCP